PRAGRRPAGPHYRPTACPRARRRFPSRPGPSTARIRPFRNRKGRLDTGPSDKRGRSVVTGASLIPPKALSFVADGSSSRGLWVSCDREVPFRDLNGTFPRTAAGIPRGPDSPADRPCPKRKGPTVSVAPAPGAPTHPGGHCHTGHTD